MRWTFACALVTGLFGSGALAQGPGGIVPSSAPLPSSAAATGAVHGADDHPDPAALPTIVSDQDLGASRAGQATVTATQTLNAVTTGNTVNGNLVAGSISLSGNALSKFNGVGNFAINTGSQVSIQSGMNLTVNVTN